MSDFLLLLDTRTGVATAPTVLDEDPEWFDAYVVGRIVEVDG